MKGFNTQLFQAYNLVSQGQNDKSERAFHKMVDQPDNVNVHRGPGRRPNAEKYL